MTMMAGVFHRDPRVPIEPNLKQAICRLLSRDPRDTPIVFESDRCVIAKVDSGAYGQAAHQIDDAANASFLVGHPYLSGGHGDRAADLRSLHRTWSDGRWNAASEANGVFAVAHYSAARQELTLISDNLGLRPVFYYVDDRRFLFSTSLRLLEQLREIPKEMDLRGVTELASFGFCLGVRTPYKDISLMSAAHAIHVSDAGITHENYSQWDSIGTSSASEDDLADAAYEAFTQATRVRLGQEKVAYAFLSGGLDSRAVVATLRDLSAAVHTYNFSLSSSQDRAFASLYARHVGTVHVERQIPAGNPRWSFTMARAVADFPASPAPRLERLVWSGDGGSVGVGHVYVSREIVAAMRAGDFRGAARTYLREWKISLLTRLLTPSAARQLDGVLEAGIEEELAALHCEDPGRAFYLFLMLNDQRRHLAAHFENIDLDRLEFNLPFFDTTFLRIVCSAPLDACLGHGFYMTWLKRFPASTLAVPWQTYPGHIPCPLPVAEGLCYQWSETAQQGHASSRLTVLRDALKMALAPRFPGQLLRRSHLAASGILHVLGLGDYRYVVDTAAAYHAHARIS